MKQAPALILSFENVVIGLNSYDYLLFHSVFFHYTPFISQLLLL